MQRVDNSALPRCRDPDARPRLLSVVGARRPQQLPVALTGDEVLRVLGLLSGTHWLVVRDGKRSKDRVTTLSSVLVPHLGTHLTRVRALFAADREAGRPGVSLPYALRRKYPNVGID